MITCFFGSKISLFLFGKNTGQHRDDLSVYDEYKSKSKRSIEIYSSKSTIDSAKMNQRLYTCPNNDKDQKYSEAVQMLRLIPKDSELISNDDQSPSFVRNSLKVPAGSGMSKRSEKRKSKRIRKGYDSYEIVISELNS